MHISEKEIKKHLKYDFSINIVKTIPSTNTELKSIAGKGADEGYVLIANEQTQGRGRLGRSFYSPKDAGVYMSILLRPDFDATEASFVTPAAAVAVCRALEASGSDKTRIKWVNDIFCNNKKVCGILTEIGFKDNTSQIDFLIIGIGINLTTQTFPDDLKSIANSVFSDNNFSENKIIAMILNNIYEFYKNLSKREFLEDYKTRSILTGKDVFLNSGTSEKKAYVIGIDDDCRLFVRLENGETEHISTGEVSIRF